MNEKIFERIKLIYKDPKCELEFKTPFELLIAVVLSAQCTDKRVNETTKVLFNVANTPKQFVDMPQDILEKYIFSCGFYKNKALAIKNLSKDIVDKFAGNVPNNLDDLTKLSGVGIKTASVVLSLAYKIPALAVDTHVFRVSNRLGVATAKTPEEMYKILLKVVPKDFWIDYHYSLVLHGRYICKARNPKCGECGFKDLCQYYNNEVKKSVCR